MAVLGKLFKVMHCRSQEKGAVLNAVQIAEYIKEKEFQK